MLKPKNLTAPDKNKKSGTGLHKNATTTLQMRQFIQESTMSVKQLAEVLSISETTVRKWRKRDSTVNVPNTPHHLNTTLTPLQEYVVVGLRYQLKMPLDRLLEVSQTFINPNVSRSGLARCLKRNGVSRIGDIDRPKVPTRYFNKLPIIQGDNVTTYTLNPQTLANTLTLPNADSDTVVQVASVTIPAKLSQTTPSSVLLGIDHHSSWLYLDIYQDNHTQATMRYIADVLKNGPFRLRKLLVRNYHSFLELFPDAQLMPKSAHRAHDNNVVKIKLDTGDS